MSAVARAAGPYSLLRVNRAAIPDRVPVLVSKESVWKHGKEQATKGLLSTSVPSSHPFNLRLSPSAAQHVCHALTYPELDSAQDEKPGDPSSASGPLPGGNPLPEIVLVQLEQVSEADRGSLSTPIQEAQAQGIVEDATSGRNPVWMPDAAQPSWSSLAADAAAEIILSSESGNFSAAGDFAATKGPAGGVPLASEPLEMLEVQAPTLPVILVEVDSTGAAVGGGGGGIVPPDSHARIAAHEAVQQSWGADCTSNNVESQVPNWELEDYPGQLADSRDELQRIILPAIALSVVSPSCPVDKVPSMHEEVLDRATAAAAAAAAAAAVAPLLDRAPPGLLPLQKHTGRPLNGAEEHAVEARVGNTPMQDAIVRRGFLTELLDWSPLQWARESWARSGAGPRISNILGFAGPALGIWLCSPLMSLIDTAVVGSSSSLELAALGPGTIMVDNLSFLYMFLSTAAANLIATAMAEQKQHEASAHLQRLLFVALVCGVGMLAFSELFATPIISGFANGNPGIVEAASRYAKIRGLAWPAVLVASVTQSASLALQDSWSPLLCLSVASAINLFGDIFLCRVLDMGIAGAAWATAVSQYAACALMVLMISRGNKLELGVSVPSWEELFRFMSLAGPIFLTLMAKVGFYTLVTYMATALGTVSLAAHQVVIGVFAVCAVCAEPLSQTAQAFLPRLCVGAKRNVAEAQALIVTLGAVALVLGLFEAVVAAGISVSIPSLFTSDAAVAAAMGSVVLPLSASLLLNPAVLAAEGVLLAARDVRFLALAMAANVAVCGGLLFAASVNHLGLLTNWWIVVLFQIGRIALACGRICSSKGILAQTEQHTA